MEKQLPRAMAVLGILLALGMSASAFILGVQAKKAASGQQSISVKGLAEKPISADSAEWLVSVNVWAENYADGLKQLQTQRPVLEDFLIKQGLRKEDFHMSGEVINPHFAEEPLPNGSFRSVQKGFDASVSITVRTKEIAKVVAANKAFLELKAEGHPFDNAAPSFLVSGLEEVKMSLISAATDNARKRAEEFVKRDGVKVGLMRSASQGAFYILAAGGNSDTDDYGGVYDKTTIDKTARVVVTIVYNIEQ